MSSSQFDCLCAGIIVADHVCAPVQRMPAAGELVLTDRMDLTVGGCAANVSVNLSRLGRRVGLHGCVGDDVFGSHVTRTLQNAGVETAAIEVLPHRDTSGTLVINSLGEDRRFIHSLGANTAFTAKTVSEKALAQARALYIGGFLLCEALTADRVRELFQIARRQGVRTVLDVVLAEEADYTSALKQVLPLTDVFLPNTDEAIRLCGRVHPHEQASVFRDWGASTVVVTCGDQGAVMITDEQQIRSACFPVPVVDSTGSGDGFAAGFIHGLLDQRTMSECLHWGTAMGAGCVQAMGASTGAFTADELRDFCTENPLSMTDLST